MHRINLQREKLSMYYLSDIKNGITRRYIIKKRIECLKNIINLKTECYETTKISITDY